MTVAELRARLAALKAEGKGIIQLSRDGDRDPTEAEETRLDEIEAEIDQVEDKLVKEAQMAERRRKMEAVTTAAGDMVTNEPNPATTAGFKSLGEFAHAVRRATHGGGNVVEVDQRLMGAAPANPHTGAGSTDGYAVPAEWRDGIWTAVEDNGDIFPRMVVEPTNANAVDVTRDETTPWGSTGVRAYWRAEGGQMSETKLNLDGGQVPLHSLYAFSAATDEILSDAPRLENQLTTKAAQAIAWKLSAACADGTGAGQPLGWMNSGALVTQAKESGQSADTIVTANVLKMFSRFIDGPGSFWYANSDTLPQLATITIGDQPAFVANSAGLRDMPAAMLLGKPVVFSEVADTVGDLGDLVLVNPNGYAAFRKAQGTRFDRSIHLYFDYGAEAFRWTVRFGGQPYLSAPITPNKSSASKSHFVALAARA